MQTVIFGRPGCPYCVRAKDLAEKLSNERDDFQYQYVDIRAEGITKEDLQQKAGKPVETVPQIFVDQQHIGGYTDFAAWVKENRSSRTSLRYEKKLATAPERIKNSKPISGSPAARKAPFMCVARKRHTTMKRTKQQIAPAQRCLCFTRSS